MTDETDVLRSIATHRAQTLETKIILRRRLRTPRTPAQRAEIVAALEGLDRMLALCDAAEADPTIETLLMITEELRAMKARATER